LLSYAALSYSAPLLLRANVPLAKADWIVVLGGERKRRFTRAAELFHQGIAPKIFVSGEPECELAVGRLQAAGVPASAITYECTSRSTYENVLYTREALAPYEPRKILIVTSWFHSSRAIKVFAKEWPTITWGVDSVPSNENKIGFLKSPRMMTEYIKYAWYKLRYQI
jgi:uncharacterized SAM-binding protein YcdF (DUF218 family)